MSTLRIDLDGEGSWRLPGTALTGRVSWDLEATPNDIALRLFWFTSGKGTEDVTIVEEQRLEPDSRSGERAFALRLPAGPYSFSGSLITLSWALELVELPGETSARVDLVVAPTPVEVRLTSLGREPAGRWTIPFRAGASTRSSTASPKGTSSRSRQPCGATADVAPSLVPTAAARRPSSPPWRHISAVTSCSSGSTPTRRLRGRRHARPRS